MYKIKNYGNKKMIDNPLENQTLEQYDNFYVNEKFEEHCTDAAKELARDYNLNPDYYEPFIEFYIEECRESDRGYFFFNEKYIIDLWWDHNKDLYETKTPYMEIKK
jgi:chorismate mutase